MNALRRYVRWVVVGALALAAALGALGPEAARAEVWPDPAPPLIGKGGENDVALIVAIENYPDISPVPGAKRNALSWERYFKDTLGVRDIIILADKDAAHYTIKSKLEEAAGRVKASGKLWFVFIGHGAPSKDGADGLLVGSKADRTAEGIYQNSLPREEVLSVIREQGTPSVLVIDACFSGAYGASGKPIVDGLQPMIPIKMKGVQGQILVLSAGKADQFAGPLPNDNRPAFSYLLVRALSGEGDADFDGRITAGEAMAFASNEMGRVSLGRSQEPQLDPGENKDWFLTPQVDPSKGCPLGQTRSADTDGQCCWHGQSWSKTKNQCIGQPDRCPPNTARLANTCGPCPQGQALRGDLCEVQVACPAGTTFEDGVCVQRQASVEVRCPNGFNVINGQCVEETSVAPQPKPTQQSSSSLSTWGWVSVGTGVALLATGIGTYSYASSLTAEIDGGTLTQVEASSRDSQISTLNAVTVTTASLSGAALITGLILLLTDGDESSPVVNMSSDGQSVLFGLSGRF
jgi:hypothetical protein